MPKHLSRHCATFSLMTFFLLAGCGQKGPLYLEKTEEATKEAPQETTPQKSQNEKIATTQKASTSETENKDSN